MTKAAIRVRIVQQGRENMCGLMGRYEFQDGVSVKEIPVREAVRLGAILSIEDLDGKPIHPSTYLYENASAVEAPIVSFERGVTDPNAPVPGDDQTIEKGANASAPSKNVVQVATVKPQVGEGDESLAPEVVGSEPVQMRVYSQVELEEVADKTGIEGLREIARPLGVKSNSITKLVSEIIEAQTKRTAG